MKKIFASILTLILALSCFCAIADEKPDVTLICINGRLGNMNTEEALTVARRIGAKVNIPTHYDMFASNSADPALFAEHIPGGRILPFNEECVI